LSSHSVEVAVIKGAQKVKEPVSPLVYCLLISTNSLPPVHLLQKARLPFPDESVANISFISEKPAELLVLVKEAAEKSLEVTKHLSQKSASNASSLTYVRSFTNSSS